LAIGAKSLSGNNLNVAWLSLDCLHERSTYSRNGSVQVPATGPGDERADAPVVGGCGGLVAPPRRYHARLSGHRSVADHHLVWGAGTAPPGRLAVRGGRHGRYPASGRRSPVLGSGRPHPGPRLGDVGRTDGARGPAIPVALDVQEHPES